MRKPDTKAPSRCSPWINITSQARVISHARAWRSKTAMKSEKGSLQSCVDNYHLITPHAHDQTPPSIKQYKQTTLGNLMQEAAGMLALRLVYLRVVSDTSSGWACKKPTSRVSHGKCGKPQVLTTLAAEDDVSARRLSSDHVLVPM